MASSGGISDQLFVSVKLESPHLAELDLAPHLFGSHPVAGSWDPCKALPLERAATAVWEFSCVVPSQHESLDFKFVLKRKGDNPQYIIEEGPNRPLGCQRNEFEMGNALFKLNEGKEVLECKVQVETEMLSPFDLAASWRAHQEYFQPSRVRGTHDVTINPGLEGRAKNGFASGLELDLDKYVVPTPNMGSGVVYAASLTENPRSLLQTGSSSNNDTSKDILHNSTKGDSSLNHYVNTMKSTIGGHASSLEEQRAMFVDRGVGSPNFARPTMETFLMSNFKLDSESKIKSDVENQGNFVNFLASEVQNAAYKKIADVEEFVKWLDGELSYFVDERAVLKQFPNWPEKKADALREAAFNYRDLKNLESEESSFHDDRRVATPMALKRMQALQDKIEQGIHNTERVRDSASGRYKDLKIPWEWMLDSGVISQLKMASLKLAKEYMNRIVKTLKSDPFANDEELLLQGVRFAFRILHTSACWWL